MKKGLVKVNLHGYLGERFKRNWRLAVKSVSEAIHAIDTLTKHKLKKELIESDKAGFRYKVLVNNRPVKNTVKDISNRDQLLSSEILIKKQIKTIDIVPVIEGGAKALDGLFLFLGVVLMALSFVTSGPLAAPLFIAGAGFFGAGLANILSKTPDTPNIEPFARSYSLQGPSNRVGEGVPVPIAYGRLRVGSHVIAASSSISYKSADYNNVIV